MLIAAVTDFHGKTRFCVLKLFTNCYILAFIYWGEQITNTIPVALIKIALQQTATCLHTYRTVKFKANGIEYRIECGRDLILCESAHEVDARARARTRLTIYLECADERVLFTSSAEPRERMKGDCRVMRC